WLNSPLDLSGVVRISGLPPSAEIIKRRAYTPCANTIWLSGPQLPAAQHNWIRSDNVTGTPPSVDTFINLWYAQNPTHRSSGERNGLIPPSVPAMGLASNSSVLRKYNCDLSWDPGFSRMAL